jgi:hypothetical protein
MSEIRPEPYEAPSVEEVDTDGTPIATASGDQAGGRTVKVVRLTGPVPALVLAPAVRR